MDPFHPYFGIEWYWLLGAWAAVAIGAHAWQVGHIVRLIRLGKPDDRFNAWPVRLREFLRDWLGQRKVLEDRLAGGAHALIFWGFLLLVSDVLDLGTGGMLAGFLEDIYLKDVWNLLVDIGYLMAGTGITIALYRRVVLRPAKLRGASIEGEIILLAIMGIVLTAFVLEGAAMLSPDRAVVEHNGWEPVGTLFASFMAGMDGATLQTVVDISYWLHMLLIGGFLIEIPQSKHSHLLGTIPNVLFQDHAPLGKQQPLQMAADGRAVSTDKLDIENLVLGASNYTDFSWRQLSDGWACTACARCQDVCPAFASGKGLNPMQIIFDIKDYGQEHGRQLLAGETPQESIIDRFSEEAIWACTTCFACVDACPVHIEHVPKLTDARRHLVMEAAKFPEELQGVFENLERNSNPWGFGAHTRGDWAEGLDIKVGEPAEYLFYVGCAGSFDNRNKKVSRTLARLMQQAGVDFSILGEAEMCNGDLARRSGNEFLFQMMAEMNIATLQEAGVKKIVTACPHCFHTLGKEYGDYGGDFEVVHHTQLLAELREQGKLQVGDRGTTMTYHDPCYMGRIDGSHDAPRQALGGEIMEMHRCRDKTFCCGAGGARMWVEEDADKRVNLIRAQEALDTGADEVGTGCPFCMTMLTDGLKSLGSEMVVRDVSEIMAEQLEA